MFNLSNAKSVPLAVRMRPRALDEIVGQEHLLRAGSPLRQLASESAGAVSVVLWGPPGVGKTTIAQTLAASGNKEFVELSAVTSGIKDVRQVMERALNDRDLYGKQTVLFLDEIHRFTKAQQDALLPGVENGWVTLVAATTENPSFSVISPLLSRSLLLTLKPLTDENIVTLLSRAISHPDGLNDAVSAEDETLDAIARLVNGDARRALTTLEAAAQVALARDVGDDDADWDSVSEVSDLVSNHKSQITIADIEQATDKAVLRYDKQGDQHYDVISAFIKSIRGSDPDAALHYLARMIEAGEDPRFIARRLIVSAAEDIGLGDPQGLQIAVAAAEAVQLIGMPEGRIPLAEATIYLATAPKSNAAYLAIDAALADVRRGGAGEVPKHLRDAHYPGAKTLGHGAGYKYPHHDPRGILRQDYLPDALKHKVYYDPTRHGAEGAVASRLEMLRHLQRGWEKPNGTS